ncbi:hypothetical protein F2Q69_00010629 [Brassica cretica]|uniref:Uncharacterized protein n=1 Tax=Brassica cretica TaxID=69181 RepID=A0A8S9QYS5_BRACR|nr:hypothetical protein F2Q69_00010629 [Brassica cretica]
MYSKPGLVLQGRDNVGIRNDTGKSEKGFDTAVRIWVVSAEYMKEVEEPAWLNYMRHWGPKIDYGREDEIRVRLEVFREEGPTGPKLKRNWLESVDMVGAVVRPRAWPAFRYQGSELRKALAGSIEGSMAGVSSRANRCTQKIAKSVTMEMRCQPYVVQGISQWLPELFEAGKHRR